MQNEYVRKSSSGWMFWALIAAAIYNGLWGGFIIFFPNVLFEWADLALPRYPEIWQCVGMVVGVYSVGYWVAAYHPLTHWPIVLVGLLGKIFGPIGFAGAYWEGTFNATFGLTIITNDLIWWVPFFLILRKSYRKN